jgi:hypothetical protein
MKLKLCLIVGLMFSTSLFAAQHSLYEEWRDYSDPDLMNPAFNHSLFELPLEGSIMDGKKAWSGHFWPSNEGGINNRWNSESKEGFKYKSPSKTNVLQMSFEQLKTLSPSEKFDLFLGRYDYPLRSEAQGATSRTAPDWAGICHGWSPASLHHSEPTPKTLTNPDGIQIPFGSSDIKALLSYYYAFYHESETNQIGLRCYLASWIGIGRACGDDLNAGAFHVIIGNKLGVLKEGFLMDRDQYRQVWNQPVVGYKSTITSASLSPSRDAASGTVREVRVSTELYYVDESLPTWEVVQGTKDQKIGVMELQYRLELNSKNEILGGEWESDSRPDFLWSKTKTTSFSGLLSGLEKLLND